MKSRVEEVFWEMLPQIHNRWREFPLAERTSSANIIALGYSWNRLIHFVQIIIIFAQSCRSGLNTLRMRLDLKFSLQCIAIDDERLVRKRGILIYSSYHYDLVIPFVFMNYKFEFKQLTRG